ncbi:MAG: LPS assembly lipoprotein LptE [Acidobacteriales bacterium]|nr:LPS assembly lipoprotein LptE [Terriglobales bacterium]
MTKLLLCLALAGCGYHATGRGSLPPSVHSIAVPAFANQTRTYKVDQLLTTAVVREFVTRTNYRIINNPDEADAVLKGTVTSAYVAPLTFDPTTGRISSALVTVNMHVSLADRRGEVLYQNSQYVFRQQYQVSREISSFFEEESPAVERLSRDFARTLVNDVLEAY